MWSQNCEWLRDKKWVIWIPISLAASGSYGKRWWALTISDDDNMWWGPSFISVYWKVIEQIVQSCCSQSCICICICIWGSAAKQQQQQIRLFLSIYSNHADVHVVRHIKRGYEWTWVIRINRTKLNEICIFHFCLYISLSTHISYNYITSWRDIVFVCVWSSFFSSILSLTETIACVHCWWYSRWLGTSATTSFNVSLYRDGFFFSDFDFGSSIKNAYFHLFKLIVYSMRI